MKIIAIILVYMMIVLGETPKLIKNKQWWDLFVYTFFLMFSFVICLLMLLGVKLPYISTVIGEFLNKLPIKM